MFSAATRTVVVVGAQWGDEGKGKLVDVLAERADWVVRYQGGANAGHTVHIGDTSFVLHQVPSGILHQGTKCAIGNGVVLDPETLFHEVDELIRDGVSVDGRFIVSERAHLVMPYHKVMDQASAASKAIGTTGRGIGPAYEDKIARRGVRVLDLRQPERLRELVTRGVERANDALERAGSAERVTVEHTMSVLLALAPRLLSIAADVSLRMHEALGSGASLLLEGAQGSLLDVDHGTYPYVTSSNTTAGGASTGVGIGPRAIHAALGVVKAYTTRVGNGPLPTELAEPLQSTVRTLGNEFGATTGRPRRCGWFDDVVVRYAARVNGLTGLAVTKLDVLDTLDRIAICTAYEVNGERYTEFPADLALLEHAVPVLEWHEGWKQDTSTARSMADLPPLARAYLARMEERVGVPITYVSVGTRRDQIIETARA